MLSEKEFVNTLLFDLRWSNPGSKSPKITAMDAQKILDAGVKTSLLTIHEGALKPVFDYKAIDIPLNYQPSRSVLDELAGVPSEASAPAAAPVPAKAPAPDRAQEPEAAKKADAPPAATAQEMKPLPVDVPLFTVLLEDISKQTGQKKKDVVAKINRLQDKLVVYPEVAALIVARELGIDIEKYLAPTRDDVLKK